MPDHFTAMPSPSSTPVASRHQRTPIRGPSGESPTRPSATTRAMRARTSSRSQTSVANAATTNSAEKTSSMPMRPWTCDSPSQISSTPAIAPSSVERVMRRPIRMMSTTHSTLARAAENRQPTPL